MKAPENMTAGEINRALDAIERKDSALADEFIAAGRGHERPSEYLRARDPLALRAQALYEQRSRLRHEIDRRYGPGAPSRLPPGRFFGPIRPINPADTMLEAIALSSPSGRMSKAARRRAEERLRVELFGPHGLEGPKATQPAERDVLLRQAAELRGLAARGMKPRAYLKRAEELERRAGNVPVYVNGHHVMTLGRRNPIIGRYKPRFMTDAQMSELINLYHLARVPLSGTKASRYNQMLWATKEFGKKYPDIGATAAYKDLSAQMNPLTLMTAGAFLRSLPRGAVLRKVNPAGGRCRSGETEIYADVERILARKGRGSTVPGQKFYHDFHGASACGRPDGTVVLRGRGSRRLWRLFPAED